VKTRLDRRAVTILLLLALLVGAVLRPAGYLKPAQDLVSTLFAPLQYGLTWITTRVSHLLATVQDLGAMPAKVSELQATVDRLMIDNVRLHEAEIENTHLRELLQFRLANPSYEMLAAEVIGRDPNNLLHYLTIDRGSVDGLEAGMPVVTARGLVGHIDEVFPRTARVMLLTDPASTVAALIQSSRATGIVQGEGRRSLTMRFVEQSEPVVKDDIVLTSGIGGTFPKRLVIGQVVSVHRSDVEMFLEIVVQSAVNFDRLESVLVILDAGQGN